MNKIKLYTDQHLDQLRTVGDPLADAAVISLLAHQEYAEQINSWKDFPQKDVYKEFPVEVRDFLDSFQEKPEWLDIQKVKIAHDFFAKEGNLYLSMLGFYSLPYCYAFADGAQVLVRSKRITDEIGMRLAETTLFVMDLFQPGNFITNMDACLTIVKVRLIHAFSRYFVSKYSKDWESSWGIPINQEDMLGTNLAFSLMVIRGFEKINQFPGKEKLEATLHYWKVVGHYMGLSIAYWPETSKEAFELEKAIRIRHLKLSEAGQVLTRALIKFYQEAIPDENVSSLSETLISFFVGQEASTALGIKERIKLPKGIYALMLELSFLKQSGFRPSYAKMRSQFLEQTKINLGREVTLSIPVMNRS